MWDHIAAVLGTCVNFVVSAEIINEQARLDKISRAVARTVRQSTQATAKCGTATTNTTAKTAADTSNGEVWYRNNMRRRGTGVEFANGDNTCPKGR